MEKMGGLQNNPQSNLSRSVDAELPYVKDRVQGLLNLHNGAFSPMLHATILRAVQSFDVQAATSGIIDAGAHVDDSHIRDAVAQSFADHVAQEADEVIQNYDLDDERERKEVEMLTSLIESIRSLALQ